MHVCGCKLTKTAPFCDGDTCLRLLEGKDFEFDYNTEEVTLEMEENQESSEGVEEKTH